MKEIEVTCQIYDSITKIIEELIKKGFKYKKEFIIQDSYFHNLKNEEFSIKNGILTDSLVVRYVNEDDKKIICKRNILNNTQKSILKVSNIENAKKHLNMLGYTEMFKFIYKNYMYENSEYVAYIQEVSDLGIFLELEYKEQENRKKESLIEFIKTMDLHLGTNFNIRKAELLYGKMKKTPEIK